MPERSERHIFLSCGEASGDRYGAALLAALRRQQPDLRISAMGGGALAAAGAEMVASSDPISVMGFAEVLTHLRPILQVRRKVWRHVATAGVDLVVPIDFPGFNLRLAQHAHGKRIPVFYAVPPQVWAWGGWRVRKLRENVDCLGTILPFEPDWFRERGVSVLPLGHPLMEEYAGLPFESQRRERERRLLDPDTPVTLGLLPGSRRQEITRLLPVMRVAAGMVQSWLGRRRVKVLVSRAPGADQRLLASLAGVSAQVVESPLHRLFEQVDVALVCSGTASLEASLAGVPHALAYRTGAINYAIARRLVRVPFIGLPNLIVDRAMVPEHVQDDADPTHLSNSLLAYLNTPGYRETFYRDGEELRRRCGDAGVWDRAATGILELLHRRGSA